MSEAEARLQTARKVSKWIQWILVGALPLAFLLRILLTPLVLTFGNLLLFGWITYLCGVLSRIEFNVEIALGAAVTLALATFGLHRILRWWVAKQGGEAAEWRPGWSLKITTMLLLLFATSVAVTGIVCHIGWLIGADRLVYIFPAKGRSSDALNSVKQTVTALWRYADDNDNKLPRSLDELVPKYSPSHQVFFTGSDHDPPEKILYYPDDRAADPDKTSVAASQEIGSERAVAYRDGSARVVPETEFKRLLQQQKGK